VEFEFPSVAMGELLASLFHAMGIFTEEYLNTSAVQSFHPQSFSSTHTSPARTFFRFESGSGWRSRSPKVLPITEGYKGSMGGGGGGSSGKGPQRFTQLSALNHTPLAKRDLKKRFSLWYERDLLMASD
jgi:hypothetical protein